MRTGALSCTNDSSWLGVVDDDMRSLSPECRSAGVGWVIVPFDERRTFSKRRPRSRITRVDYPLLETRGGLVTQSTLYRRSYASELVLEEGLLGNVAVRRKMERLAQAVAGRGEVCS